MSLGIRSGDRPSLPLFVYSSYRTAPLWIRPSEIYFGGWFMGDGQAQAGRSSAPGARGNSLGYTENRNSSLLRTLFVHEHKLAKPVYIDHCFHPDCSWRLKVGARQYYKPDAQLRLEGNQWNAYPRHAACRYWQAAGALTLVLASPLITSFQNWMIFSAAYNLLCTYSPSLIKIRRTTFTVSCSQAYIQTDGQTYTSAWILWYPN